MSDAIWYVRNTNVSGKRGLWHLVKEVGSQFSGGKINQAHTVCKQIYDFPQLYVIFTQTVSGPENSFCEECFRDA